MIYISNQDDLESFVEEASKSCVLAIDTEFLREKTYYPQLCLLQMSTDTEVVIVDPFEVDDLSVIASLLTNEAIVKLFHAGSQDLEILFRETGVLPKPIFDTQIAAALIGQTQQVGYGTLVHTLCGVTLKKADSFTDWSRRPLTDSQLAYAADDVIYLPQMYEVMTKELREQGRLDWLHNDFEQQVDPARFNVDPYARYKRLKRGNQLSRRQLACAREAAAWREIEAQKRNVPRKWVLTDEQIVEACKREPRNIDDLFMIRGMKEHLTTRDARELLSLIKKAYNLPEEELPMVEHAARSEPNVDAQLDLMTALVRQRAKENNIAMQTLASHGDLTLVARGHFDEAEVLRGWRKEIVGDELLDLLDGRIVFSIVDGALAVSHF